MEGLIQQELDKITLDIVNIYNEEKKGIMILKLDRLNIVSPIDLKSLSGIQNFCEEYEVIQIMKGF